VQLVQAGSNFLTHAVFAAALGNLSPDALAETQQRANAAGI